MQLINIISISDGNEKDLDLTIQSVKNQKFNQYKHIVIAKKLSNNFIQNNKSKKILFIVGKDKSRYHAMNIGENMSTKQHTLYLNSGDILFSKKSLTVINQCLISKTNLNGQFSSILKYKDYFFYPKKKYFLDKNTLTHSSFIRSPIKKNEKISYNVEHIITADGNWMRGNINVNGLKKFYIPISIFSLDGISTLPSYKTILIKKKLGISSLFKEIIKFILVNVVGKKFFYMIIYSQKYNLKYEKIH